MSTAVTEAPKPEATLRPLRPDGHAVMLRGVSWEEYLAYSDEPGNEGVRMYYSDGGLLLMTTGRLHERICKLLGLMLHHWGVGSGQDIMTCGRWTLRRQLKEKGLEADDCYYISNLAEVDGKVDVSLDHDPPPDLAIEVDITTHSEHKFGIYSALGVSEIWVWSADHFAIYRLSKDGTYEHVERSQELPEFPLDVAAQVLLAHHARNDMAVMKEFREALSEAT